MNTTDPTDTDTDDDGLCDGFDDLNDTLTKDTGEVGEDENQNGMVDNLETNPLDWDTDDGGWNDGYESTNGYNGTFWGDDDPDTDTLNNTIEDKLGTSIWNEDSDGDFICDGI